MLKFIGVNYGINVGIDFSDKMIDDYKRYFSRYSDPEKAFLLFVRDEIAMASIELYKLKPDGTTENETLNNNFIEFKFSSFLLRLINFAIVKVILLGCKYQ